MVEKECPERSLPSRYVFRDKNAGLLGLDRKPLPVKAKARLCLQGHLCPDSKTGQVQVDSPTTERVSTMIFLHLLTCFAWSQNWCIGDISNAFLQGAPLKDKPDMFMRQPKQGLKGMRPGQIIKLLKPVYSRPDAPSVVRGAVPHPSAGTWLEDTLSCDAPQRLRPCLGKGAHTRHSALLRLRPTRCHRQLAQNREALQAVFTVGDDVS